MSEQDCLDAARQLQLLWHAKGCERRRCTPECETLQTLWPHLLGCAAETCGVAHCQSSRALLAHFHACQQHDRCRICSPTSSLDALASNTPRPTAKTDWSWVFGLAFSQGHIDEDVSSGQHLSKAVIKAPKHHRTRALVLRRSDANHPWFIVKKVVVPSRGQAFSRYQPDMNPSSQLASVSISKPPRRQSRRQNMRNVASQVRSADQELSTQASHDSLVRTLLSQAGLQVRRGAREGTTVGAGATAQPSHVPRKPYAPAILGYANVPTTPTQHMVVEKRRGGGETAHTDGGRSSTSRTRAVVTPVQEAEPSQTSCKPPEKFKSLDLDNMRSTRPMVTKLRSRRVNQSLQHAADQALVTCLVPPESRPSQACRANVKPAALPPSIVSPVALFASATTRPSLEANADYSQTLTSLTQMSKMDLDKHQQAMLAEVWDSAARLGPRLESVHTAMSGGKLDGAMGLNPIPQIPPQVPQDVLQVSANKYASQSSAAVATAKPASWSAWMAWFTVSTEFGAVQTRLTDGLFTSLEQYATNVRSVFTKAATNNDGHGPVPEAAKRLLCYFDELVLKNELALVAVQQKALSDPDACGICGGSGPQWHDRCKAAPSDSKMFSFRFPHLFCLGRCKDKPRSRAMAHGYSCSPIRRNTNFYEVCGNMPVAGARLVWCTSCYKAAEPGEIMLPRGGFRDVRREDLLLKKNDDVDYETWVQCDSCER